MIVKIEGTRSIEDRAILIVEAKVGANLKITNQLFGGVRCTATTPSQ